MGKTQQLNGRKDITAEIRDPLDVTAAPEGLILPLPLHLVKQLFGFGLEGHSIPNWRRYTTQLVHPEIRRRRLLVPLALRTVQEIDIPRFSRCAEHFLPLPAGELVAIPIIA